MNFLDFKNLLFEKAKIAGFNECEIYFSDGESISKIQFSKILWTFF